VKQHIVRIALGLAITLFFIGHVVGYYNVGFINQLDNIIYDARLKLTMPRGIDNRVVILDIDEQSLGEIGRWPWSRNIMAQLIRDLFDTHGVALLGFDVVWAERDTSSGIETLDALARKELKEVPAFQSAYQQLRERLNFDGMFAASLRGRPVVLGYYFNSEARAVKANAIPEPVLPKGTFSGREIPFAKWVGYTGNLPEYLKNAAGAGHFNPHVDEDGVSRRVPMILEFDGAYYESLSLAMVRALIKQQSGALPKVEPGFPPERFLYEGYSGLEWLTVGPATIPVDEAGMALIPYRGRKNSFPYLSLADVIKSRVEPGRLKGKIVLVGTTAPGLLDLRSTPVDSVYPGVEIHANLIAGMIDRSIKQKPPYILAAEVVLLLIGGVALSLLIPMLSALWATVVASLGVVLIAGFNFLVWTKAHTVLPLAASILMTAFLYTMNMAYGYFVESRSKRQFTELFGQYVPPELVDKMAQDPEKYSMEGRSDELTVMFSDIVGFTSISESLEPKELASFINEYLTSMSLIIRNHRGTLDKYIGDAIMAFWGAPVEDREHARQGVLAALAMQAQLAKINDEVRAKGWPEIRIGIGLNSGVMRVGDMGSKVRRAYTVMGDPVNLGSRLEGLTREYGTGVLVGEATREKVKDVVFREVDRVKVKGKDEPVAIFQPLGLDGQVGKKLLDEVKLWHQCLKQYRAQDWDQAEVSLLNLQRMAPGSALYQAYAERITAFRKNPPPSGWDGVTKFTTK
jgi:adenylate cyclase